MSYIFLTKQLKLCLNLLYNIYLVLHVILQSCLVKLLEAAKRNLALHCKLYPVLAIF